QAARMARNSLSVMPGFTRAMVAAARLQGKHAPPPYRHSSPLFHSFRRQELEVEARLLVARVEQQRRPVFASRVFGATGELVRIAKVVGAARIPRSERHAGFPQGDLAPVVELARDACGGE